MSAAPTSRAREVAVIAGVTAFGALVFYAANLYLGSIGKQALGGDMPGAMSQLRLVLGLSSAALLVSSIVLGVLLRQTGNLTRSQHHYPPTGARSVEGLRERDGVAADRMGGYLRVAGLVVMLFGVAAAAAGFALAAGL